MLEVIILAAGMGKRMHSKYPKVLHEVAKKPILFHAIETAFALNPSKIHVVLGHQNEVVQEAIQTRLNPDIFAKIQFVLQSEQLGTAHAVKQAVPNLDDNSQVVLLYGDTPLTPRHELERLLAQLNESDLALMTAYMDNPFGYGRIIRDEQGTIVKIVEEKDCTPEEAALKEVNTGMIATTSTILKEFINKIDNNNSQKEYYLTDIMGKLVEAKKKVALVQAQRVDVLSGINNKQQLAFVERLYQELQAEKYMQQGLTLADPKRFDVRGTLSFGQDCFIDTNVIIEGEVILGNDVHIGSGCILKDVSIADNSIISPYTIMEKSELKERTTIGPFARLRPGNTLEADVHVGNFVEVKNSHIGAGTKSGHLSYIGDTTIGTNTNIGAGTITCNYDGANKHRTIIGNNVFVGSDTQLVAPVTVEDGATIGAGTTVTRTVKQDSLFVTRANPRSIDKYVRPVKKK